MTKDLFQQACIRFLNIPYKWGGDDPGAGLDCSGLLQELLAMVGLDPKGDQTAQGLYEYFLNNSDSKVGFDTGSIVFFGQSLSQITHVALLLSPDYMIEAGGGGSRTNTLQDAINQNAFVRIRPVKNRKDMVSILTPKGLPWNTGKL